MTTIRRIFLGYVAIAMLLGAGVASATQYAYTPIDYPDATYTQANGINVSGQIVGWGDDDSGGHGFLKVGAAYTPIDYPGAYYTNAFGINNSGQIVGWYEDDSGNHGFIATPMASNLAPIYQLLLLD